MIIHFIYISRLIADVLSKWPRLIALRLIGMTPIGHSVSKQAKLGNQHSTASQSPDSVNYTNSNNNNEDTKTSLISSSHMTSQLTKY